MAWNDDHSDDHDKDKQRNKPNPWGKKPQRDDDQRPSWGGGQHDNDIDFEQVLGKIRDNLGGMIPGGMGSRGHHGGGFGKIIGIALVLVVAAWLLSGIYFIQPNENGVVLTFGKYTRTDETPGLKWKMPWPVQTVSIVNVTTERRIQVGFNGGMKPGTNAHSESLMLTGDENIVDTNFVVLWRIGNAKDYLYSIRDPEDTIQMVAASTMREIIGQTDIQPVLTDGKSKIQSDARALMQKLLDEYHAGVTINNVQLQNTRAPIEVKDAFDDVTSAGQEKQTLKNLAEAYRNDIIPRAKGEAEKMRQDAEAYKQEVVSRATGDAKRFNDVYQAYKTAKDVTAERMYLETMQDVLKNAQTVVMGNEKQAVLPYLPLNTNQAGSGKGKTPATPTTSGISAMPPLHNSTSAR